MGKALSGELSCPCDRSCFLWYLVYDSAQTGKTKHYSAGVIWNSYLFLCFVSISGSFEDVSCFLQDYGFPSVEIH